MIAGPHTSVARPRRSFPSRRNLSRSISPAQIQPRAPTACSNPSRINTSVNPSFFIKSLIMNDFKSIRITTRDNKPSRINTSENHCSKPFRINTSKKHPGEGAGRGEHKGDEKVGREVASGDPPSPSAFAEATEGQEATAGPSSLRSLGMTTFRKRRRRGPSRSGGQASLGSLGMTRV
jgi:hypothetical protein